MGTGKIDLQGEIPTRNALNCRLARELVLRKLSQISEKENLLRLNRFANTGNEPEGLSGGQSRV